MNRSTPVMPAIQPDLRTFARPGRQPQRAQSAPSRVGFLDVVPPAARARMGVRALRLLRADC
jgi:hypothetical protein